MTRCGVRRRCTPGAGEEGGFGIDSSGLFALSNSGLFASSGLFTLSISVLEACVCTELSNAALDNLGYCSLSFLLLNRPKKLFFSFVGDSGASLPLTAPFSAGVLTAAAAAFDFPICFSTSELSSRSVESPSSILRGIPRTGRNLTGSGSSSLESSKREWKILGPDVSSSSESAKRDLSLLGGPAANFGFDLPNPAKADEDL